MKPKKFDGEKQVGGICNRFRALCAEQAMDHHQTQKDGEVILEVEQEPFAERLTDLLSDLMHLCHQQEESFEGALMMAMKHFEGES